MAQTFIYNWRIAMVSEAKIGGISIERISEVLGLLAFFGPMMGGREPTTALPAAPEKSLESIKGRSGWSGSQDEKVFASLMTRLKAKDEEAYEIIIRLINWRQERGMDLRVKLGERGARWLDWFLQNKMRSFLVGMPSSDGKKTGGTKREWQEDDSDGKKVKVTKTDDQISPGSSVAVDFLKNVVASTIKDEYDKLPRKLKGKKRWDTALENSEATLQRLGIPKVPRPEDVPNLQGFQEWLRENGMEASRLWGDFENWIDEEHAKLLEHNRGDQSGEPWRRGLRKVVRAPGRFVDWLLK